jgi:hypothetical protein
MLDFRAIAIGPPPLKEVHSHPFENVEHYPDDLTCFDALKTITLETNQDILIFRFDSFFHRDGLTVLEAKLGTDIDIVFLSDCGQEIIAPRILESVHNHTIIRVFTTCCLSAVYLKSDYAQELKMSDSLEVMIMRISFDLNKGYRVGAKVHPQLAFCNPLKPHKPVTVNVKKVKEPFTWSSYLLLLAIAFFILVIIVCVVVLVQNHRRAQAS